MDQQLRLMHVVGEARSPVNAAAVAERLGVSVRTVKSLVKRINTASAAPRIVSSHRGYALAPSVPEPASDTPERLPRTYSERAYRLAKRVLIETGTTNVFDLCEELFVSYSTLKSTIAKMNRTFESFGVYFSCDENRLVATGAETSQRRLASHVIFEGTNGRFLDLTVLERSFSPELVRTLTRLVRETFARNRYYLNDFSFANILVHLSIMIARAQHSKQPAPSVEIAFTAADQDLVQDLCDEIEEALELSLADEERRSIGVLLVTNVNQATPAASGEIRQAVGATYLDLGGRIAEQVLEQYGIDLDSDFFMPRFALHLKALLARIATGSVNVNPMLQTIKMDCRVIYDVAVFMAINIGAVTGTVVAEEEVGFLALHVGAELERQRQNTDKIRSVLLCPEYRGVEQTIYNQLLIDHASHIDIIAAVSSVAELRRLSFDLLLTTIPVERGAWTETHLITPFRIAQSRASIADTIGRVQTEVKSRIIRRNFDDLFLPELFYPVPPGQTRDEVLRRVCTRMMELGCVNSDFFDQVAEREAASSTAFGELAIPHSVHLDAIRTCVAVVVCRDGLEWVPGKNVNLVLLTAINRVGRRQFTAIYEGLLSIFEDEPSLEYLCSVGTFSALRQLLAAE